MNLVSRDPKIKDWKHYEYKFRKLPEDKKKKALLKIQREVFKDDILQPHQAKFKTLYYKNWKKNQEMDRQIENENVRMKKEKERMYEAKASRAITLEQKTLRDLHREHPEMVSEEDIQNWQT